MAPHAYLSLKQLKATALAMGLNSTGTHADVRLRRLVENVSRQIDRVTNRHFYVQESTLYFSGDGGQKLLVPDLISVTSLKEDSNGDGTFDTTWDANDYTLFPYNAAPTAEWGRSHRAIEVNLAKGTQDAFVRGVRNYEIVGHFGWNEVTEAVTTVDATGSFSSTATAFSVTDSETVEIGWTLKMGTEQLYVSSATGTAVTVERGVNGSVPSVHANSASVSRYVPVGPVEEAAQAQCMRLFKRAQGGFTQEMGVTQAGALISVTAGMDGDVKEFLSPFRKIPMGGG